jgi:hypothetical protein
MVDRHHSSNDPYVKMAKQLRIELYEGTKNKPESRRETWRVNPLRGCLHVKIKPLLTGAT